MVVSLQIGVLANGDLSHRIGFKVKAAGLNVDDYLLVKMVVMKAEAEVQ